MTIRPDGSWFDAMCLLFTFVVLVLLLVSLRTRSFEPLAQPYTAASKYRR